MVLSGHNYSIGSTILGYETEIGNELKYESIQCRP